MGDITVLDYVPGMDLPPDCFIQGMPNEVYHALPGISKSGLDLINRSPAHYKYRAARLPTRAMEIGTAIHTALLEPDRFQSEYMLLKDVKDRRASEYKQAVKVHGSERVLVSKEADNVAGMQEAVYADPRARELLEAPGYCELSAIAGHNRARFDKLGWLPGTDEVFALDVKKTQDARPEAFARSVANYRYHVQAAYYMDVYKQITGHELDAFYFLAVEEDMPHACRVYRLDDEALMIGREEYLRDLDVYHECIDRNEWPAYSSDDEYLSLPGWLLAKYENELDEELI